MSELVEVIGGISNARRAFESRLLRHGHGDMVAALEGSAMEMQTLKDNVFGEGAERVCGAELTGSRNLRNKQSV